MSLSNGYTESAIAATDLDLFEPMLLLGLTWLATTYSWAGHQSA